MHLHFRKMNYIPRGTCVTDISLPRVFILFFFTKKLIEYREVFWGSSLKCKYVLFRAAHLLLVTVENLTEIFLSLPP